MTHIRKIMLLLFAMILIVSSTAVAEEVGQTDISANVSEVVIDADIFVSATGYTVNGMSNPERVFVLPNDTVVITLNHAPFGSVFKAVVELDGETRVLTGNPITIKDFPRDRVMSIPVHLSLTLPPSSPDYPDTPDVPDVPTEPENPDTPDTPGSDTPGSDEPYTPILPPAGIVYNIAGAASLVAGFLLLFLLFFMRGNLVYRTLKKHAKEHGEKPDKEEKKHLKEIASAVVSRIKDDEKYPEWKKNSDVMKHLGVDICLLLDEMKYREAVPREALVTEILEKARGKINRHRL